MKQLEYQIHPNYSLAKKKKSLRHTATNNQLTLHLAVSEHSQHYFHLSLHFFSLLLTGHFLASHTPGTQQSP